jgi:transcriptional regulator GlxA family with amidase domain
VGHVPDEGDRVDLAVGEPRGEARAGERARLGLFDVVVGGAAGDLGVQLPGGRAPVEDGRAGRRRVLHDDDRHRGRARGVDGARDVGERAVGRRELDRQVAREIFVLDVDDEEGAAGGGRHGETSRSGWARSAAACGLPGPNVAPRRVARQWPKRHSSIESGQPFMRPSKPPHAAPAPRSVAVVAFDRISPFHLSVPCIAFDEEAPGPLARHYRLRVCAAEPGRLRTTAGFDLGVRAGLRALARAQIVVVPSWRDLAERPPEALLEALRRAHRRGACVVGLCLGAFVLAEAGLLDGREATTHWYCAPEFARRYPRVRVRPDVLYVDEGDVLTSAGSAAGIDCCLHLIRRQCGAEIANQVARRLVVSPHRQGGQAQYIEQPLPSVPEGHRLAALLDWARANLHRPLDVDGLAARAAMSRRSFTRHFRRLTGTSLTKWLIEQRLALAQRLLETTDRPIDRVAEASGFGSGVSLRQHFAAAFDVSPSAWRREFRGERGPARAAASSASGAPPVARSRDGVPFVLPRSGDRTSTGVRGGSAFGATRRTKRELGRAPARPLCFACRPPGHARPG